MWTHCKQSSYLKIICGEVCHAIELALEVKRFVHYDSYIARLTEQSRYVLFESIKLHQHTRNFRGVNISWFCQIPLKNKFSQVKVSRSSFPASHCRCVENFQGYAQTGKIHNFQPQKFSLYGMVSTMTTMGGLISILISYHFKLTT